jgi:hypothetical protein
MHEIDAVILVLFQLRWSDIFDKIKSDIEAYQLQ